MDKKEVFNFIHTNAQTIMKGIEHGATVTGIVNGVVNPMAISWYTIGQVWNKPIINVYVREHRHTYRGVQDEFTVNIGEKPNKEIMKITGTMSGRDINKVDKANLTLIDPKVINTPGFKELPYTLECKVITKQPYIWNNLPDEIKKSGFYPKADSDGLIDGEQDYHTIFTAEIVSAYIIN